MIVYLHGVEVKLQMKFILLEWMLRRKEVRWVFQVKMVNLWIWGFKVIKLMILLQKLRNLKQFLVLSELSEF